MLTHGVTSMVNIRWNSPLQAGPSGRDWRYYSACGAPDRRASRPQDVAYTIVTFTRRLLETRRHRSGFTPGKETSMPRFSFKKHDTGSTDKYRIHLVLFFVLMMVACITGIASAKPQYGGRLVMGGMDDAWGFDAIKAKNLWGAGFVTGNMIMERLFELGPGRELIPVLGLSANHSTDGKTWTIPLREGVKFHDQTPFNATAVVKHWRRILNPENRYRGRFVLTPIESVEQTGEYEVTFHLAHAWLPFIDALTDERGFTALIPSPKAVEDGKHNRSPVGTGPFVFKEWKSGDHITVVRNPDYWQAGKPYLDEAVVKVIPDHQTRYASLISGQVDLMVTDRPQHVKKLQNDPSYSSLRWNAGIAYFALNTAKPPLDDIQVRKALAYAWDQKKYLQASFKGIYEPARDILSGALDCGDVGYPDHDPDKAKTLLAEYGQPVTIEYIHSATKRGQEVGAIAQQIFKQAGVVLNPTSMEFSAILKRMFGRNYDLASWILPRKSDIGPMLFASFHTKGPWNVTRFSNREVDALLEKQRLSTDARERKEIFCRIARIVNENVPLIYLFQRDYFLFSRKGVNGIRQPAYALLRLSDAWLDR